VYELRLNLSATAQRVLQEKCGISTDIHFEVPVDSSKGDLTTSAALQLAKKLGKPPRDVALILAEAVKTVPGVASADVAGAGYVNVVVSPSALVGALNEAWQQCDPTPSKGGAPVIVEYSQPNIAKPLGIHHILSTVIGQALFNLYTFRGFPALSWNYMGDWGTQFGKLSVAFAKWGTKPPSECTLDDLLALYVKFHEEAEKDATLEDAGREAFRRLEQGDAELRVFWKDVLSVTKRSLGGIYQRLHVRFDLDVSESFYEDKMGPILDEGKRKKVFVEGNEGALIVRFSEESKLPPYMVLKGDGATLYSTRDIAQMRYRIDTYHPQSILICTDVAQKLHFEQLEATCRLLGWELPTFENVLFGRMRFVDRKMSTRKGNIVKLEHVLDEAVARAQEIITERGDAIQTDDPKALAEMMGTGALVYGILSQNRKMDIVFDWDKMLSFEGNSAPYLQYTHARACSVLRKAGADTFAVPAAYSGDIGAKERSLLHLLFQFGATVEAARSEHLPHKLTNYLYEVCQSYNSFYNAEVILKAEGEQRELRLALTHVTARILKTGAELLTLRVPDRM
jgi:arginyl-tRNA synthetase